MISVQILDYVYSADANNQVNMNNVTTLNGWNIVDSTTANFPTSSGSTKYILPVTGLLTYGLTYDVSLTVSDKTGAGDIGFSSVDTGGSPNGMGSSLRRSSDGTTTGSFTVLYGNKDAQIFAANGTTGTIRASITQASSLNFNESIVGSLDVGDSENFPLALTFGISDVRSLDARTGTYSKTFEIPATKNNNKIFKAAYYEESFIPNNYISNKKPCRILVDNHYSVTGHIQLVAVGKSTSPSYYSCVFYGDNVDWASSLDNKLLKDLSTQGGADGSGWDNLNNKGATSGVDLAINLADISATWEVVDAENTQPSGGSVTTNTSPVVYPIISYGEMNEGGIASTIQALKTCYEANYWGAGGYWGWDNNKNPYGTPEPVCDWRPCIFIYDIMKQIFFQEGYTIVSNFIETTMFKKLIMALPNFNYNNVDERVDDNSWEGTFNTGVVGEGGAVEEFNYVSAVPVAQSAWQYPSFTINWNTDSQLVENTDYTPAIYNDTYGIFTMQEYGLFDINLNGLGLWLESSCYGAYTAEDVTLGFIEIRIFVKTVGQTSWNEIAQHYLYGDSSNTTRYQYCSTLGSSGFPQSISADDYTYENRYLNKGDQIYFQYRLKIKHHTGGSQTIGFSSTLFGGSSPDGSFATGVSSRNAVVSFIHKGEHAEYGQTYDLKNVIDSSSTQLGFLKGVSHSFNLQFSTDTVAKTVTIEPFNDFYKNQSDAIDWSSKVDFSQNQEDKWIPTELLREVIFKYITDGDDKVVEHRGKTYWDGILDEYPYREFLSNEFSVGKAIFENPFFAGTANTRDKENNLGSVQNAPYGAVLWGNCDTTPPTIPTGGSGCRPAKGYNFVPRLLNWTRLQCATVAGSGIRLYAVAQTWISTRTIHSSPVGGATNKIYPQANSYDKFDSTIPLLTYGSHYVADRDCATGSVTGNAIKKGLYQEYYQKQIEMMKSTPRLKTIYLNLKLSDIQSLDLRKLVYIDGSYYRINQIVDFQPNNNNTTQVELVLWEEQGNFSAVNTPGF